MGTLIIETGAGADPTKHQCAREFVPQGTLSRGAPHRKGQSSWVRDGNAPAGAGSGVSEAVHDQGPNDDALFTECMRHHRHAAVLCGLPALGSALGARSGTHGRFAALASAAIGAAVAIIPGYALGISGQREETGFLEGLGVVTLTVAVPVIATLTDRLFRAEFEERE